MSTDEKRIRDLEHQVATLTERVNYLDGVRPSPPKAKPFVRPSWMTPDVEHGSNSTAGPNPNDYGPRTFKPAFRPDGTWIDPASGLTRNKSGEVVVPTAPVTGPPRSIEHQLAVELLDDMLARQP